MAKTVAKLTPVFDAVVAVAGFRLVDNELNSLPPDLTRGSRNIFQLFADSRIICVLDPAAGESAGKIRAVAR